MRHTANETSTQTLTRLIKAADRQHPITLAYLKEEKDDNGKRTGRIRTYSIHRTRYLVTRPAAGDKPARTTGLATVTVLYPVDCPIAHRVQLLADALAA